MIVANPTSGRGRGRRIGEEVSARLRKAGRSVELRFTAGRGDAESIARGALADPLRFACIVACGGDGTVQEVVNSVVGAGSPVAVGLAPAGRCNDFARALGILRTAEAIAAVLLYGEARAVDLGRVNGRLFCTVATAGIDAEVSEYVDSMTLPLRGTPAYLYGAIQVLRRYQCRPMRIAGDFGTIDRPMLLASSANTSCYGGAIHIAPQASPTDGLLDVCLIDPMTRWRAMRLLPTLLAGRHGGRREVHFARTRRMTLETDAPMVLWADGERIASTPATIEVVPAAVRVFQKPNVPE